MDDTHDSSGSMGHTLLVFLLGVAVGAAVAILYAPASGTETRAQIAEKAEHLKEKASQLKDRASHLTSQVAEKAGELKDKAVAMMHRAEQQADEAVDATTQKLAEVSDNSSRA